MDRSLINLVLRPVSNQDHVIELRQPERRLALGRLRRLLFPVGPTPSEATERRFHSSAVVPFVLVCMLLLTAHALGGDGLRDNVILAEREQHVDHRPLDRNPRFCTSRLWPTNTHIMDSRSSWLRER